MRIALPILVGLLVVGTAVAYAAENNGQPLLMKAAPMPGEIWNDIPIRSNDFGLRADSTFYGQYYEDGGEYYAFSFDNKSDGSWTFDRGTGPPPGRADVIPNGEGWLMSDLTANTVAYWKVIDNTLDLGVGVPPPIIAGAQSLWCGADKPESDDLCWECGAGYGNNWCQRVTSPELDYDGSGDVTLQCLYWNFTEPCYDGSQVYLKRADNSELMLNPYPAGECSNNTAYTGGDWTDSIGHYSTPVTYTRVITEAEMAGSATFEIIFEFSSDGGWSDEDCEYATIWGPCGIDNVSITGDVLDVSYNFETGFQGWTAGVCDPVGLFVDITDVGCYTILDPCVCRLENNILELHRNTCDEGDHPVDQENRVQSPICWFGNTELKTIFMEFDMYAELPQANGVLHRPGWLYYPFVCDVTGAIDWSPRVGQGPWNYVGDDPVCGTWRYGGTTVSTGVPVPADVEGVIALIDLLSSCEQFAIDPCSGITNFTPIYDNLSVIVTEGVNAPIISFDTGRQLQDVGSYPAALFDPRAPGPANTTYDNNMDTEPGTATDVCGDSLVVAGPQPGNDPNYRWEARFWWRVFKRAPFQSDYAESGETRYKVWKDRTSDGAQVDRPYRPQFAWGWMDSVQVGFVVTRNKFKNDFREDDDDFVGEEADENEMLWDDVFYPGTQLQYFVTANYVGTPGEQYYLPDTTGGFFMEMEVLPGNRVAYVPNCGGTGFNFCVFFPSILYIDAYNRGAQFFVENALQTVLGGADPCLNEEGCEIDKYRLWDRYDYLDASSNWNAPFVRGSVIGSNNGMTLNQILGYRGILLNTGTLPGGCTQDEDYDLYDQWLIAPDCDANVNRQFFHMNGDKTGEVLEEPGGQGITYEGLAFMNNTLGATLHCDAFNGYTEDPDCTPTCDAYCLRWLPVGGGPFDTMIDVDAFGSYCPNLYGFNVFDLNGGMGNRYYEADDPANPKTDFYGQVCNQDLGDNNYKTALDGVSWHHMTARDAATLEPPEGYCPRTVPEIVYGSLNEIGAALLWGFLDQSAVAQYEDLPKLTSAEDLAQCQSTWNIPTDVDDEIGSLRVNRLYQNEPNPFNPRTTIRFSLAQEGQVEIAIYDVNGRLVKTLVDGKETAGTHAVVWDGTNDRGTRVGSGVYWSQMKTGAFSSNKQLVILK